jgi:hypothetical protein
VLPVTDGAPGVPGVPAQPAVLPVTAVLFADSPTELYAATVYVWLVHEASPLTVALVPVTVARTVLPS